MLGDETASTLSQEHGGFSTPGILLEQDKKRVSINVDILRSIALSLKSQLAIFRADNVHQVSKYCCLDQDLDHLTVSFLANTEIPGQVLAESQYTFKYLSATKCIMAMFPLYLCKIFKVLV